MRLRQSSRADFDALVERLRGAAMFDAEFYRALWRDIPAHEDAFEHFLLKGEGRGALPYASYLQPRVVASLLARGLPVDGSVYAAFVDAQLAALRERSERDRSVRRATWLTPAEMSDRIVRAGIRGDGAPERPALRRDGAWIARVAFVIPFVAPDVSLRSLSLAVERDGTAGGRIQFSIATYPAGPAVVGGVARYDGENSSLICTLDGGLFERGRRYFLRLACDRATGLELIATEFYPVPLVAARDQSSVAKTAARDPSILETVAATTRIVLRRDRPRAPAQADRAEPRPYHAAVVTILYRKAEHVASFLEAVFRQSYAGPITVVFVDDGSPDAAFADMERRIQDSAAKRPANIAVKIVRNAENRGNCLSRNAGIAAVNADIYVVIDADCLINRDFVSAHVAEHRLPGTDAVIGPYNIETNGQDGLRLLRQLEHDPEHLTAHANMQDELLPRALVNTVTRNLSISRRWLDAHGAFDPMLSYSAKAELRVRLGGCRYRRTNLCHAWAGALHARGVFHPHLSRKLAAGVGAGARLGEKLPPPG